MRQATTGVAAESAARSLHAAGDYRESLEAYEAAFSAYREAGEVLAAARAARTVGWFRGWVFGDWAVAQGWFGVAAALLDATDDARALGWVRYDEARRGCDLVVQRRLYQEAIAIARDAGDADLECDATASLGMMLVFSGLIDEGMAELDRSLAAICGGGVTELPVIEGCLCGLLNACERTNDVDRAEQWLAAAQSTIRRGNLLSAAGYCRAHYAGILISSGEWDRAEAELERALELLDDRIALRDSAVCRLAKLRLLQGRIEDAAQLLGGLEDHGDAGVVLANLHVARDEPARALELVDRLLVGELPDQMEGELRAVAVACLVRLGRTADAMHNSERLNDLASKQATEALRAIAAAARAQAIGAEQPGATRSCWHEAISRFGAARMPVDAAAARLGLATQLAATEPDVAIAEATTALAVFDRVGAQNRADRAAELLRSLGAPARTGPKRRTVLTKREDEVLALLAHGLTNVEIGARLFISSKTVEHHVGRLLAKLGLRSRTEAAAHAVRTAAVPAQEAE